MTLVLSTSPGFGRHGGGAGAAGRDRLGAGALLDSRGRRRRRLGPDRRGGLPRRRPAPGDRARPSTAPDGSRACSSTGSASTTSTSRPARRAAFRSSTRPARMRSRSPSLRSALMFALARDIQAGHADVTAGRWVRQAGTEITGKTLGIIGLGNIGRTLALKAARPRHDRRRDRTLPGREFVATHRDRRSCRSTTFLRGPTTSRCTSSAAAATRR